MGYDVEKCANEDCDELLRLCHCDFMQCPNEECGRLYCNAPCGEKNVLEEEGRCLYCTHNAEIRKFTLLEQVEFLKSKCDLTEKTLLEQMRAQ